MRIKNSCLQLCLIVIIKPQYPLDVDVEINRLLYALKTHLTSVPYPQQGKECLSERSVCVSQLPAAALFVCLFVRVPRLKPCGSPSIG